MNGIYGKAGSGLADASWAKNKQVASIGAAGELRTAELLNQFAGKAAIFHDLRVPLPGFKSNIDHAVVSGKRILLIDSKVWAPGFYWTFLGVNRSGTKRVDHTAKDQSYLKRAMQGFLNPLGGKVEEPRVAVWSSSRQRKANTLFLRVPGAVVLPAEHLAATVSVFIGKVPADPAIVRRLNELVVAQAIRPHRASRFDNSDTAFSA